MNIRQVSVLLLFSHLIVLRSAGSYVEDRVTARAHGVPDK